MEIHTILRKLEPLMAEQVAKWQRTLDTAEPEVKALLERQIRLTAHREFGNFRDKLLLSLPPADKTKGAFHFGTVLYDKPRGEFGISSKELLQNLAIFGRSGAGKTNVAFRLLAQLVEKRIPFLFLDWKRTARHLLPILPNSRRPLNVFTAGRSLAPFPFNPFIIPPGVEQDVYVNHLIDILAAAYTLGDGSKHLLRETLTGCYQKTSAPSLTQLEIALASVEGKGRVLGWKVSAQRALSSLRFLAKDELDSKQQTAFARSFLQQNTIVELDALDASSKQFLIPLLCYWVYAVQLEREEREQARLVVFIEEAHHVLYRQENRSKESLMNVLMRQGRELGICFVVIDQHPHHISSTVLGNCYTTICLNQKNPTDINKAAGLSLLAESEKRFLSLLPVGEGIVKLQDRWRSPFLVKFPLVQVKKGTVTDALLKEFVAGRISLQTLRTRTGVNSCMNGRVRRPDSCVERARLALLRDALLHPDAPVRDRYRRLGLSVSKGTNYKQQLVRDGLLTEESVKTGKTFKTHLGLTDAATTLLIGAWEPASRKLTNASLIHEYWKHAYAQAYQQRGYQVAVEASRDAADRNAGRVDVLAAKRKANTSERLAIEIETGKSDVIGNVKRNLLAGFEHVLVVATDEEAMCQVERQLCSEDLYIPGRVDIELATSSKV